MTAEAITSIPDQATVHDVDETSITPILFQRLSVDIGLSKFLEWSMNVNSCLSENINDDNNDVTCNLANITQEEVTSNQNDNACSETNDLLITEAKSGKEKNKREETELVECKDERDELHTKSLSEELQVELDVPEIRIDDLLTQVVRHKEKHANVHTTPHAKHISDSNNHNNNNNNNIGNVNKNANDNITISNSEVLQHANTWSWSNKVIESMQATNEFNKFNLLQGEHAEKLCNLLHLCHVEKWQSLNVSMFYEHLRIIQAQPCNLSPFSTDNFNSSSMLLPPQLPNVAKRHTLVLDLDETLVHSSYSSSAQYDACLPVEVSSELTVEIYVAFRPFLRRFLEIVAPLFEVVIYTASLAKYCEPLMNLLDSSGSLGHLRLVREHCSVMNGLYIKDLSLLGRDLSKVVIIDNSPVTYCFQPRNAISITSWFDDPNDNELEQLIPLLTTLAKSDNVYDVLDYYNAFSLTYNCN